MILREIVQKLDAQLLCGEIILDCDFKSACGSDLMSDVMAYVKDNIILLTGLVNPQVIRTAEMMDIKAVVFVRGKMPGVNIITMAQEKGIAVLSTEYPMFLACGRLYSSGLTGRGA
jgi:predicted transcriptional regulator